jgi:hypothetical protein
LINAAGAVGFPAELLWTLSMTSDRRLFLSFSFYILICLPIFEINYSKFFQNFFYCFFVRVLSSNFLLKFSLFRVASFFSPSFAACFFPYLAIFKLFAPVLDWFFDCFWLFWTGFLAYFCSLFGCFGLGFWSIFARVLRFRACFAGGFLLFFPLFYFVCFGFL